MPHQREPMVIWKFCFTDTRESFVMPRCGRILHVGESTRQHHHPMSSPRDIVPCVAIWVEFPKELAMPAKVEETQEFKRRTFEIIATGEVFAEDWRIVQREYIGTVCMQRSGLVWHVHELTNGGPPMDSTLDKLEQQLADERR